jgi:hypothetical protein
MDKVLLEGGSPAAGFVHASRYRLSGRGKNGSMKPGRKQAVKFRAQIRKATFQNTVRISGAE